MNSSGRSSAAADDFRYALVVSTSFQVRESAVSGFLVMALSVASDRLLHEVDEWEGRQGTACRKAYLVGIVLYDRERNSL